MRTLVALSALDGFEFDVTSIPRSAVFGQTPRDRTHSITSGRWSTHFLIPRNRFVGSVPHTASGVVLTSGIWAPMA